MFGSVGGGGNRAGGESPGNAGSPGTGGIMVVFENTGT